MNTQLLLLPFLDIHFQRVDEIQEGIRMIVAEHITSSLGGIPMILPLAAHSDELHRKLILLIDVRNCLEGLHSLATEGLVTEERSRFRVTPNGILAMALVIRELRQHDETRRFLENRAHRLRKISYVTA